MSTGAEEARVVKEIEQLLAHKTELMTSERGPASGWERAGGACEAPTVGSHRGRRRLQYRQTEAWLLETEEERELHVVQQALCLVCVCVCQHVRTNACTGISFSCSECMCTGKTNQKLFGCIGESPASCHEENKAIPI